jgi:hypothetical protein
MNDLAWRNQTDQITQIPHLPIQHKHTLVNVGTELIL